MAYLVLTLAAAAAAQPPLAPVPPEKTFGEWTVACDNLHACGGVSLTESAGDETAWVIHFSRRAGANAEVLAEAAPAFGDGEAGPVTLVLDGKKSAFGFGDNGEAVGAPAAMLAAIAAAKRVDLIDRSGKKKGFVPVKGSSAALRWIDDIQGRAGTVTALVAKGAKPSSAVPAPPAAPRIAGPAPSKVPPTKLAKSDIARIQKQSEFCDNAGPDSEVAYHRLDAAHTLAIVPCGMGAYQGNSLVVTVDSKGRWSPAVIEQYERFEDGPLTPADYYSLTEADFDVDNRLLLSTARGRGLGDCGMSASWAWDGKVFRLASYQALNVCQGAMPGSWLPRWQTANDPLRDP